MKSIAIRLLVSSCMACIRCIAADETSIIVATGWSEPVESKHHAIRGRLLIVEGDEPAYGGPKTEIHSMTFVELQNLSMGGSVKVYFDVMGHLTADW